MRVCEDGYRCNCEQLDCAAEENASLLNASLIMYCICLPSCIAAAGLFCSFLQLDKNTGKGREIESRF